MRAYPRESEEVKMNEMHSLRISEGTEKLSEFSKTFLRIFPKTPRVSAEFLKSFSFYFLFLFFVEIVGMKQDKNSPIPASLVRLGLISVTLDSESIVVIV